MTHTPDLLHLHFLQDSFGFDLHPERRQWAFVSKWGKANDGKDGDEKMQLIADLHLMPTEGGFPQSLGLAGMGLGAPLWSPDGRYLAWTGSRGVWIHDLAAQTSKCLFAGETCAIDPNKMCASGGQFYVQALWHPLVWHPDSRSLYYVAQEDDLQSLYEVAVDGSQMRRWYQADGQILGKAIAPDGHEIALSMRFWDGHSGQLLRIARHDGSARQVCALTDKFYLSSLVAYAASGELIFRANQDGWARLWRQAGSDAPQLLDETPADVTSFVVAEQTVYYVRSLPAFQDAVCSCPLDGRPHELLAPRETGRLLLGVNPVARELYLYQSQAAEPGDLYCCRWEAQREERLTRSHPLSWERHPVRVEFLAAPCPTVVYYPPDFDAAKSYPALIWIKGGPSTSVRQNYQAWPQWLAREGYLVACPNYRGSTGFGVAHLSAGAHGEAGKADLEDIAALAEALKTLPWVQPQNLAVLGHSWGGYLTLMAVTRYPDMFKCAMASAGLYDLMQQQLLEDVRHYTYWLYGGWSYEQPERYAERSPLTQAGQLKTPLLMFHGKADPNVPFAQLKSFVEAAEKTGAPLETHFFEGEGHSYQGLANRKKFYGRALQFLDRHLKPWDFKKIPQGGQHLE